MQGSGFRVQGSGCRVEGAGSHRFDAPPPAPMLMERERDAAGPVTLCDQARIKIRR